MRAGAVTRLTPAAGVGAAPRTATIVAAPWPGAARKPVSVPVSRPERVHRVIDNARPRRQTGPISERRRGEGSAMATHVQNGAAHLIVSPSGREIGDGVIRAFADGLRGPLLRPGDDGYDAA